jgi:hypothetical protein
MNQNQPHRLMAVPQTWPVRLEILKAINTLAVQCQDDAMQRRRTEIAAIRNDLEDIRRSLRQACQEAALKLSAYLRKYDPDQPRVPAGNRDGGQWTKEGGSGSASHPASIFESSANSRPTEAPPSVAQATNSATVRPNVQSILAAARRLNIAAGPGAYLRCLNLCYPLLERFQRPGSDANTWDFHKCMNACLARNL